MFNFTDQVVLITGAAGNLGYAVARGFKDAGAKLALVDLAEDRLRELYSDFIHSNDVLFVPADLTEEHSVQPMVDKIKSHFSKINVLANIAGGFTMGPPIHETPIKDWDYMINLNARTMLLTSQAVIPIMLEQKGGRIVSVSARAAAKGKANMGPYCASKAAVITLTESLAAEYKHDNINTNCILPGTIDTPQNRSAMPAANHSKWVAPSDLANVILFLASDAARAVNGAAIPVYGNS